MIVDVDQVLTPEEFVAFEVLATKSIEMARSLGRQDKVSSISRLLEQTRIETQRVYSASEKILVATKSLESVDRCQDDHGLGMTQRCSLPHGEHPGEAEHYDALGCSTVSCK